MSEMNSGSLFLRNNNIRILRLDGVKERGEAARMKGVPMWKSASNATRRLPIGIK